MKVQSGQISPAAIHGALSGTTDLEGDFQQELRRKKLISATDVVIIGSGPYGLSLAVFALEVSGFEFSDLGVPSALPVD
jgi:hypothetical protein